MEDCPEASSGRYRGGFLASRDGKEEALIYNHNLLKFVI
jgi:hypothetical protein